jgi:hypothetical protein
MSRGKKVGVALGIAAVVSLAVALRGVTLLPVSVALGPCIKDWTAKPSWSPRQSALASVSFEVGGRPAKICYGRPSARGRVIYGVVVPYDSLWRTGANEPTRLYTAGPIKIAGISLPPGRYSLYTRPAQGPWTLFLNNSTLHWGNDLSPAVLSHEIGQGTVYPQHLPQHVETFTIGTEAVGDTVNLLLDWEITRVVVPITPP